MRSKTDCTVKLTRWRKEALKDNIFLLSNWVDLSCGELKESIWVGEETLHMFILSCLWHMQIKMSNRQSDVWA